MTEKEFYLNCLNPIKVYDTYVSCGVCAKCKTNKNSFSFSELRNLCTNTIETEKLSKTKKNVSYKQWWKRYIKIQNKIVKLQNKIKKLEGKI